jgi:hypothetical protein
MFVSTIHKGNSHAQRESAGGGLKLSKISY